MGSNPYVYPKVGTRDCSLLTESVVSSYTHPQQDDDTHEIGEIRAMLLSQQRLQQILGVLWLIDGLLQVQQMFTPYMVYGIMMPTLQEQPAPVAASLQWIIGVTQPNLLLVNLLIAGVELAIGLSLLLGQWIRASLVASVVWALIAWYSSEGMGLLLTGGASVLIGAPGAFLLYALLDLAAYPRRRSHRTFGDTGERGLLTRTQLRWVLAGLWCLAGSSNCSPPGGCRARSPGASR
jgi:hypothetical protein